MLTVSKTSATCKKNIIYWSLRNREEEKQKPDSTTLAMCMCGEKEELSGKKNNQKWKTQIKSIELFIPGLGLLLVVGCLTHVYCIRM